VAPTGVLVGVRPGTRTDAHFDVCFDVRPNPRDPAIPVSEVFRVSNSPYRELHAERLAAKHNRQKPPRGEGLVRWIRDAYAAEAPPLRLHERATGDDGAPRLAGPFIAYITAHPKEIDRGDPEYIKTDGDEAGTYLRPLAAALWRLEKRSPEYAAIARAIACEVFDPESAVEAALGMLGYRVPDAWRKGIARDSLVRVWMIYTEERRAEPTWIDKSESQQAAEDAA
jgi:hypothetical protein